MKRPEIPKSRSAVLETAGLEKVFCCRTMNAKAKNDN
jgi:hypothetical protein